MKSSLPIQLNTAACYSLAIFSLIYSSVCMHVLCWGEGELPALEYMWRSETTCTGWFSPFTAWVLGIELRLLDSAARTFTRGLEAQARLTRDGDTQHHAM